jgi:hypothetical protein
MQTRRGPSFAHSGNAVVPYLLEAYRRAKRGEMRVVLVFHAIRIARTSDDAIALASRR